MVAGPGVRLVEVLSEDVDEGPREPGPLQCTAGGRRATLYRGLALAPGLHADYDVGLNPLWLGCPALFSKTPGKGCLGSDYGPQVDPGPEAVQHRPQAVDALDHPGIGRS